LSSSIAPTFLFWHLHQLDQAITTWLVRRHPNLPLLIRLLNALSRENNLLNSSIPAAPSPRVACSLHMRHATFPQVRRNSRRRSRKLQRPLHIISSPEPRHESGRFCATCPCSSAALAISVMPARRLLPSSSSYFPNGLFPSVSLCHRQFTQLHEPDLCALPQSPSQIRNLRQLHRIPALAFCGIHSMSPCRNTESARASLRFQK